MIPQRDPISPKWRTKDWTRGGRFMAVSVVSVISEISEITIQSFACPRQCARRACVNLDIVNSRAGFSCGRYYPRQVHCLER
ncbi:hypothetical protein RHECNPAF_930043 [Rhizobium etli CNPAF512]|nr:hypothetical protein RHECNPAF_930043 [Rhizobium etli CNPAF512]